LKDYKGRRNLSKDAVFELRERKTERDEREDGWKKKKKKKKRERTL
jgi:hypothetical protein